MLNLLLVSNKHTLSIKGLLLSTAFDCSWNHLIVHINIAICFMSSWEQKVPKHDVMESICIALKSQAESLKNSYLINFLICLKSWNNSTVLKHWFSKLNSTSTKKLIKGNWIFCLQKLNTVYFICWSHFHKAFFSFFILRFGH